MYLELGKYSPEVKIGIVSASRQSFVRELAERRLQALLDECRGRGIELFVPGGECSVVETRQHALDAAGKMKEAGCAAAVLFLGNFSPEIEDAAFVKAFGGPAMMLAAAEETGEDLYDGRGDALCGMLSAALAVRRRGLMGNLHLPALPVADAAAGAVQVEHFIRVARAATGIRNATLGLFGPRPRDFETCNYNLASLLSLGVEVEEFGLFDLEAEVRAVETSEDVSGIIASMKQDVKDIPSGDFEKRLAVYEKAVLNLRDRLRLSGMTTQCWVQQEKSMGHVPCFINARMAARGFPVACENDAYSLAGELLAQYVTDSGAAILDLNHSIPPDLSPELKDYPGEDLVGMFHCGNTDPARMVNPAMKHQAIMKRSLEPEGEPDITRGTLEGRIAASPVTVLQLQGAGDGVRAYVIQGEFLDVDPKTFGSTGTAYLPGFMRFYRNVLLGRFHHHAAVAFAHCGKELFDALKLLGVEEIHTPNPDGVLYPGENPFR